MSLYDLIHASAHHLPMLEDGSVSMIATSPPFFGLRKYDGEQGVEWPAVSYSPMPGLPEIHIPAMTCELGLEPDPSAYIGHLILCLREWWRVLRDDGVAFINLGDSYFSSAQRATAYDTFGRVPEGCRGRDCLCGSLCGVCRVVYHDTPRTDDLLAPMLVASLSAPILERMATGHDHLPTSDLMSQAAHILDATRDSGRSVFHDGERLHAFRASMPDESSRQLLDECLRRVSSALCLLCARSSTACAQESVRNSASLDGLHLACDDTQGQSGSKHDTSSTGDASGCYNGDRGVGSFSYPYSTTASRHTSPSTLKPKDLLLIPARFALAAQADGWYVRSEIVWAKGVSFCPDYSGSVMPESVRDRPTKAHETVWLLAKQPRYYYDAEAVKEPAVSGANGSRFDIGKTRMAREHLAPVSERERVKSGYRSLRSVWAINPGNFPKAHFAVWPPALVEPMVKAGTSERGVCPVEGCGAPWERVVEREAMVIKRSDRREQMGEFGRTQASGTMVSPPRSTTTGWQTTCDHDAEPVPATVLDPFSGSGTTGRVAIRLGRKYIGVDLSKQYLEELAPERLTVQMELGA